MKNAVLLISTILTLAAVFPAVADVPDFVTYSGRLTDGTAWSQSTTVDLTFRVYDCGCQAGEDCNQPCEEGEWPGMPLHEQEFENAPVENGYFSVMLTGVGDVFGTHDKTWLTVCVGEACMQEDDLIPRQQIGSVPYAVHAGNSERIDELALADLDDRYVETAQGTAAFVDVAGDSMYGSLGLPPNGLSVGADQLVVDDGNVGIGKAKPSARLHIAGNGTQIARIEGASNDSVLILASNAETWDLDNDGNASIADAGDLHLRKSGGSVPVMTWKTAEFRIGIATTEPSERLHIKSGNLLVERTDSGYKQGLVIMKGGYDKPTCNKETSGAITYAQSGGVGHFWGCRGTGNGEYEWVPLDTQ